MYSIEFDELKWINTYLEPEYLLNKNDLEHLKTFAFMWDMFEAKACDGVANAQAIANFIEEKLKVSKENTASSVIDAYYSHFNKRYIENGKPNAIFERMTMNVTETFKLDEKEVCVKEYIQNTLLSSKTTERDRFLATLLIIYRLRSNFFLRSKNVIKVNQQYKNFSLGNQIIALVLNMYKGK
ncbi:hypothetical protein [Desnuesiella massiliensis]|uniref:hypothetical protein n=1 Tax=Desnuesiella massiliensis TaxID=1650662 RepID=UPI0006E41999|nr:hypothetical protein [Desnuesiella massiliensis]